MIRQLMCYGLLACLWGTLAYAQSEVESLRQEIHALKKLLLDQQQRLQALEAQIPNTSQNVGSVSAPPQSSSVSSNRGVAAPFIPEIGALLDVVGSSTQSSLDEEGNDRFSVRALELVLGHDVDPYSRLDATIAFSDEEGVELEEAYATIMDLPGGTRARLGRIRPLLGKASPRHADTLETVDHPRWIQHYFGVEGMSKSGLELSGFLPLSGEVRTYQLSGGILEGGAGEEGEIFGETKRRPTFYSHLANAWDFGDSGDAELGATYLLGSADEDSAYEVNAFGVDLTFRYRPHVRQKITWQSEALFQRRSAATFQSEMGDEFSARQHPWGVYSLLEYRFAEQWAIGARYDWVEPINNDEFHNRDAEIAWTSYLTFFQSEFARWRIQYQHLEEVDRAPDDRFFLQGTFAIGTHKHQIQ
jgi:hypothetical protein